MEEKDPKKEAAKLKRKAQEIAGEIHDIVEEKLWSDYAKLPELAQKLVLACENALQSPPAQ